MILGFQGTTVINYPGQISSVIFLSDCNFHCPYCYNKSLVFPNRNIQPLSKEYIIDELKSREGFIDGVCISGGEPTLYHFDLIKLIEDIKFNCPSLNIKLDTNGSRPEVLKNILELKLVDYIAMDFKTSPDEYKGLMSKHDVGQSIIESLQVIRQYLKQDKYEIRITVLRDLFNLDTAKKMSKHLVENERVFIQNFKYLGEENHINIKSFENHKVLSYNYNEILNIIEPIRRKSNVKFRGF